MPFSFGIYLSSTSFATLAWFAVPIIFANLYHGPVFAMAQALAPLKMRAMAAAILLFMSSFIGMGIGPQLVGILSDLLHPLYGADFAALCAALRLHGAYLVGGAFLAGVKNLARGLGDRAIIGA